MEGRLVADPRLDPYRGRVALLIMSGHLVGRILVSAEYIAEQTGGHGWWRRWSPFQEVAAVHLRYSDQDRISLSWVDGADLVAALAAWSRHRFHSGPEGLGLRWLSRKESHAIAQNMFGVALDDHGQATPHKPHAPMSR